MNNPLFTLDIMYSTSPIRPAVWCILYAQKCSNGKSFIDYRVKEYLEEKFCSKLVRNEQHILYIDSFRGKVS